MLASKTFLILSFEAYFLDNTTVYTSTITPPADPSSDSPDWILRQRNSKVKVVTLDYDPPITVQHVAVFRFDRLELALLEVEVYGKFHYNYT